MSDQRPSLNAAAKREAILAPLIAAGYRAIEPAILQPAGVFLDISGEELAKRLYLTSDADGREWCLRPEFTIPVGLEHLAGGDPARRGDYAYFGRVFRQRGDGVGEFWQAGVESLGRADSAAADADVLRLALDCAAKADAAKARVRLGDTGLFSAVIEALDLPAAWARRLKRDFGQPQQIAADLAKLSGAPAAKGNGHSGVLAALAGADREAARALVQDLLAIGGLAQVGGRTIGEIAERFLEQADLSDGARIPPPRLDVLTRYLALSGGPGEVLIAARDLLSGLGSGVDAALDAFAARGAAFAAAGIQAEQLRFEAAFGRRLDYYSGLVFEIFADGAAPGEQLIGGGRYDNLLKLLGAPAPVPAVGFSIWVERLPGGAP